DWTGDRDAVTLQGDLYGGDVGQSVSLGSFSPPGQALHYEPLDVSGGNVLATWRRKLVSGGNLGLQAYYDRTEFLGPQIGETRNTFDVDFTHHWPIGRRQRV